MKNRYRVRWSVNIEADNPEKAAEKAWKLMSIGSVEQTGYFRVYDGDHRISLEGGTEVDLANSHIEDIEPGDLIKL
jgi:hypothetical protein